jgi:hypothetical protein
VVVKAAVAAVEAEARAEDKVEVEDKAAATVGGLVVEEIGRVEGLAGAASVRRHPPYGFTLIHQGGACESGTRERSQAQEGARGTVPRHRAWHLAPSRNVAPSRHRPDSPGPLEVRSHHRQAASPRGAFRVSRSFGSPTGPADELKPYERCRRRASRPKGTAGMSEQHRTAIPRGGRTRADVRQALLRSGFSHLYPGIPPGEWQPAAVMADLVLSTRSSPRHHEGDRDRVLDERHFQFRGLPSAGTQDDQRRSRLEDRRQRRAEAR